MLCYGAVAFSHIPLASFIAHSPPIFVSPAPAIKELIIALILHLPVSEFPATNIFEKKQKWRAEMCRNVLEIDFSPMGIIFSHFLKTNLHTHTHKVVVTVHWSVVLLNYYSFLNPGRTITSEKYAQQINKMHQNLQYLQLALVNRKGLILFQDNA